MASGLHPDQRVTREQDNHDFDPVLPSQVSLPLPDTPERRLLAAVLEDAVRTYQRLSSARDFRGRRLFREVEEWFASEHTDGPFAFVRICEVLGLDGAWIRAGLARWRAGHMPALDTVELPGALWLAAGRMG